VELARASTTSLPRRTRTFVLRLLVDGNGAWYAVLSEPGDDDGWRVTCVGLNAAWCELLGRLNTHPSNEGEGLTQHQTKENRL
jgi:hypothetical protein